MSQQLANQIAAGEVVERPASVIKELLENSIDSGAKQIKIYVECAGSQYIKVEDDGCGIPKDDLIFAIKRHATSKITTVDDLIAIETMGFRGEALASISSVARVRLTSRAEPSIHAWSLYAEDGACEEITASQYQIGTKIEVMDLFYNVPARKRFMRKEATEWGYIDDLVKKIAMAHNHITIQLFKDSKLSRQYIGCSEWSTQAERLKIILGSTAVSQLRYFSNSMRGLSVQGFLGLPTLTRSVSDQQFIIVNKRVIKDPMLSHALKRAYQGLTYQGRQPVYIINLTVDYENVDVNVHPTKDRVRFDQSQLINNFIFKSARDALAASTGQQNNHAAVQQSHDQRFDQSTPVFRHPKTTNFETIQGDKIEQPALSFHSTQIQDNAQTEHHELIPSVTLSQGNGSLGYAIEQIQGVYILARNDKGLLIVDMHAAHERILLEKMRSQYSEQGIGSQSMLLPINVTLTNADWDVFVNTSGVFDQLGFVLEKMPQATLRVMSVPNGIHMNKVEQLLIDIISELRMFNDSQQMNQILERIFATISCHAAIRANRKLTMPEMNNLLRQIEDCSNATVCNHGRPTTVQLNVDILDHLFHRGQ